MSAFDNAVVTIGEVSSGNTWNVIADHAYVQGTVRSFDEDKRNEIEQRLKAIGDGLAKAFNVEIETIYHRLPGAVVNDEKLTNDAITVAKEVGYNVSIMDEPLTIGEDFSDSLNNTQAYLSLLAQTVNMIYIIRSMIRMSVF